MITRSGFLKCLLALPFAGCMMPLGQAKTVPANPQFFDISWVKDPLDPVTKIKCEEFAGDATPQTLAKIGGFVSKSASSQSQALGTGGPSQTYSLRD